MPAYIDLTNQRFGLLVALKDTGRCQYGRALWLCRCNCGKEIIARSNCLRRGDTKSCGCLQKIKPNARRHGMAGGVGGANRSPEYNTWLHMHQRCSNPNSLRFKHYGGRGICVCERWNSFDNFFTDMGPRLKGFSIERINVDGNYEPSNCKWIPKQDQSKNRRPFRRHGAGGTAG